MKSSPYSWGHRFNIAGLCAMISSFILLPFFKEPAFILLTIGGLLCALALACYKAPGWRRDSLADAATPKQLAGSSDTSLGPTQPPVAANELWRFKMFAWIVLAFGVAVGFLIFRYGDAPRPFVEWLTAYVLAPMVATMFAFMGYALLRFGRACRKYAASPRPVIRSSREQSCQVRP
jgi:hypothetical protein